MIPRSRHDTLENTGYGKNSKELIEFVGQLRALGAHIDLELPRIVVIGNQSAGKSSLVEAISGISVPRDAGTCTRCPMECRLAHSSGEWTCQIKIRWEYEDNSNRCEEVEEIKFGPLLTDKKDVESMLRRAQAAVLNPDVPAETFLDMSEDNLIAGAMIKGKKPLLFSRNVVCVELAGPDLVDLSFVDLPGIVQNADSETVQLVEDLVNSYIKGNSLILVTLPMSDDIENQKAARLAKLADPSGLRTIGVMTKPDTLAAGSTKTRDLWLEVLEGRRHPLLHGYYCTRQPDDDERTRGISAADARVAEATFFQNTTPWASSNHQHRLGITNLVQNISKLLTQIIRESLPAILDQVATQLESCNAQLEKLPPAITTEPTAFVLALVTAFCTELTQHVRGSPTSTELVQGTRRTYKSFRDAIRSSAPPFVPYKDAAHAPRDISEYVRLNENNRTARTKAPKGTILYLEDVRRHINESVTRELPGNIPYTAKLSLLQAFQQYWEDSALICFEGVRDTFKNTVTSLIAKYFERYANLVLTVRPVTSELMSSCTERTINQIQIMLKLETSPFTQNNHYFSECRDKWLAKYKDARAGNAPAQRITPASAVIISSGQSKSTKTPTTQASAKQPAKNATNSGVAASTSGKKTSPAANKYIGKNAPRPKGFVSEDDSESDDSEDEESDDSSSDKEDDQDKNADEEGKRNKIIKDVLADLARLGYTGLKEEDLGKLNPPDIYEDELQVMAEVRAYFQVAYKRVSDYIPLTIDHQFLYDFVAELQRLLFERLGLGTMNAAARCSSYIAEDPTVVATRDELLLKKKRLENVQRALCDFGM